MWVQEPCNPIKLQSLKKKSVKQQTPEPPFALSCSLSLLGLVCRLWQNATAGLQIYHVQTVIIAAAACYWPKWIECHRQKHTQPEDSRQGRLRRKHPCLQSITREDRISALWLSNANNLWGKKATGKTFISLAYHWESKKKVRIVFQKKKKVNKWIFSWLSRWEGIC